MRAGGILFWVLGGLLLIASYMMDRAASSSQVVNLGRLQDQMMFWQGGLALIVAGSVLFAAGKLSEKLDRLGSIRGAPLELEYEQISALNDEEAQEIISENLAAIDMEVIVAVAVVLAIVGVLAVMA